MIEIIEFQVHNDDTGATEIIKVTELLQVECWQKVTEQETEVTEKMAKGNKKVKAFAITKRIDVKHL